MLKSVLNICIVNYKTPELVVDCLATLIPDLNDGMTVVVIDNNSGDDSVSKIASWLVKNDLNQHCILIKLLINGGFSAGYNTAMKACPSNYYLLLNSDTLLRPGAVMMLLNAAKSNPEVGLIGPQLEWPDGAVQISCFRDPSPFGELIASARTRHVTALLSRYVVAVPFAHIELNPQWISFAAVLIKDDMLKSIGMLDEKFFMYFEDCEYCFRARTKGWKIIFLPSARVVHLHGQSSEVEKSIFSAKRLPRYYYASRARYFRLRYGVLGLTIANFAWYIGRIISKLRETFGTKTPHLPEMSYLDIWTNWKAPLQQDKPGKT